MHMLMMMIFTNRVMKRIWYCKKKESESDAKIKAKLKLWMENQNKTQSSCAISHLFCRSLCVDHLWDCRTLWDIGNLSLFFNKSFIANYLHLCQRGEHVSAIIVFFFSVIVIMQIFKRVNITKFTWIFFNPNP